MGKPGRLITVNQSHWDAACVAAVQPGMEGARLVKEWGRICVVAQACQTFGMAAPRVTRVRVTEGKSVYLMSKAGADLVKAFDEWDRQRKAPAEPAFVLPSFPVEILLTYERESR